MRKSICILLAALFVVSMVAGCGGETAKTVNIGSGENFGANNDQPWSDYDALIAQIKAEPDLAARAELMYQAEEMLRETYCVLPIYYYTNPYLKNADLEDMVYTPLGIIHFKYASLADGSKDLTVCVGPDPETIDPALNSSVDGAIMLSNAYSCLYAYSNDADGNVVIVPDCAEEIVEPTALDGGKYQYVITLKEGLKWSDGTELKASDFVYAWNRAVDPATAADYQYIFDVIDGYDAENPNLNVAADDEARTVTVVTTSYCAYFNQLLAFPTYFPVRQDMVDANGEAWATTPETYISNGAFRMKEWIVGDKIVFEKNPNYWDAANVKLDTITFALSDDDDAIFANFENGTYQYADSVSITQIPLLKADPDRFNVDFFIGDYIVTYFL